MTQTPSQTKFNKCLLVSRHNLLPAQEEDINQVCVEISKVAELPTEPRQLAQTIAQYDVVVGTLPLSLIVQILQNNKKFISFSMKSVATVKSEEEAKPYAEKYRGRVVVLPGRPGEPMRVSVYQGLELIKEVKVVSDRLTVYPE